MNQNNPETYALTARFPLDDAARIRDKQGNWLCQKYIIFEQF